MADWGQKAKDKDRDAAIKVLEDAAARGQIVDADKLKRIQEVEHHLLPYGVRLFLEGKVSP